ncbi:hypothetical protein MC885_003596 [Smutsia gigantea]|nr:hypothetical protein MC885_003596 [Smutsia gigantea]
MNFGKEILHCSRLPAENNNPSGVLQPHPGGPRLATPTRPPPVLPVWPMEEQRMLRPARAWQSPVAPGLDAWEDFVRRGGGRECCTLANLPFSLESPYHRAANWLRDVAGGRFPMGLCGSLLPGDRRLGNEVYDVIVSADQ